MSNNQPKAEIKPAAMYPTANSLEEALAEIKTRLPIENSIQLTAAIMLYHNTLLKELSHG